MKSGWLFGYFDREFEKTIGSKTKCKREIYYESTYII